MIKGLPPPLKAVAWAMKKFKLDKRVAMALEVWCAAAGRPTHLSMGSFVQS